MHGRGPILCRRALLLVVVAGLGWNATNTCGYAQSPTLPPAARDLPAAYTDAVRLALQEYELGNYDEARVHFLDAHEAFPNARSLRFLGKVEYDLENYVASIDFLERSLASGVRRLDEALRADVQWLLGKARGYVTTYTVHLSPEEATLEVDDTVVDLGETGNLTLQVGEHAVAAHAEGYQPQREVLEVVGGPDAKAEPPLELHLQRLPESTSDSNRKWWIIGGAAGAVLAGVASALALSLPRTRVAATDGGSTGQTLSPIPD